MKNIILIGMMGCGKTTVGRLLAQALGRELVDTDEAIERREGRSISDIFAQEGEPYFRDLEAALCQELAQRDGSSLRRRPAPAGRLYGRLGAGGRGVLAGPGPGGDL